MDWVEKYWWAIIIVLVIIVVGLCNSCANITATQTLPDGTKIELSYIRWFNQEIGGFTLTSPSGWVIGFEGQKSEFEAAFNLGAASVGIGGDGQ